MTASASAMMSFSRSIAAGFSIFASSAARSPISERASATSSGRWTNDSAIQSALCSSANCRSSRSLSVSAGIGTTTSGTLTPLLSETVPPTFTSADDLPVAGFERLQAHLAVVDQDAGPGPDRLEQLGMRQLRRAGCRPAFPSRSRMNALALFQDRRGRPRSDRRGAWAPEGRTGSSSAGGIPFPARGSARPAWPSASGRRGSC